MEREMAGVPNHAQWNKSDRERQIRHDITYEWNLKSTTSEYNKKRSRCGYREQTSSYQWGEGKGAI